MTKQVVLENIGELVTLAPLVREKRTTHIQEKDLGRIQNAWLACKNGEVKAFGQMPVSAEWKHFTKIDAEKKLVLPGLVDCHTHPVFSGSRHMEFAMKLAGETYQEIAKKGGGIRSTVFTTQKLETEKLSQLVAKRLDGFLKWGVTTVEVKSGYGLSVTEELRHLEILRELQIKRQQKLVATCLAFHAFPVDGTPREKYIEQITKELLPRLRKEELATFVDAFIEEGYYHPQELEAFMKQAKSFGLGIRIHADEFSASGGAVAAARWGAHTADHLQYADRDAIKMMAKSKATAVLLPATSLYSAIPFTKAKIFREEGVAIALATDFNPGSAPLGNLPFVATLGAIHCGLSPWEAIAGVTYIAACSLGLGEKVGALVPGFDADLLISPLDSVEAWIADMGQTPPEVVWV